MAGPRANLAVTKDGETYNKLQRPENYLNGTAISSKADERKRELAAVDDPTTETISKNKRAKTTHVAATASNFSRSNDKHPYRNNTQIADYGMRSTLPIDDEAAEHSDDSLEAFAYLRSVRSEASTIPSLLVASTIRSKDTKSSTAQPSTTTTSERVLYHDGVWASIDDSNESVYGENWDQDNNDPHELYYNQLVKRFEALRSTLEQEFYGKAQPEHDPDQSSAVNPPSNRHEWLYTIDRGFPTPSLVCQLDERNIKRGLEYCVNAMNRFDTISQPKSCWIWTLLALSGDIGTLDSQKMGHIRDLAIKAAEMSNKLHAGSEQQDGDPACHSLRKDLEDEAQDGGSKVGQPVSCDANAQSHALETGYVRSEATEVGNSTPETLPNTAVSGAQNDASPQSNVSTENHGSTEVNTNVHALEEARARLLTQLGDNLIQAGMPAPALKSNESRPRHREQLDQNSDTPLQETKIRTIPSRAEAERQRQVMRLRDSTTAGLRQPDRSCATLTPVMPSAAYDATLCAVDLNTRVTIDMILTVVAECYGQRDLLEFRKPW